MQKTLALSQSKTSLMPPLFIEVSLLSHESVWSYVSQTDVVSSNLNQGGRGVQHYMIKFVSDLRHVGGFLRVLRFPPPIKLTIMI
jgi:hypothetical protein